MSLLRRAGRHLPGPVREGVWKRTVARRSSVRWGNLRRTEPFSRRWGSERGLPVDRFYIERFLRGHAGDMRGRALEIGGSHYTTLYGSPETADALDIDPANELATIHGDLADPATLPEDTFDCFVLTQTLQFVARPGTALVNAYRCLAPGGVLLVTVPATSQLRIGLEDLWRWAPRGFEELVRQELPADAEAEIRAHGNLVTAVAFLEGLAADELRGKDYARDDPQYPLVVTARLRKPASSES